MFRENICAHGRRAIVIFFPTASHASTKHSSAAITPPLLYQKKDRSFFRARRGKNLPPFFGAVAECSWSHFHVSAPRDLIQAGFDFSAPKSFLMRLSCSGIEVSASCLGLHHNAAMHFVYHATCFELLPKFYAVCIILSCGGRIE